jgi:hypothetical protein
MKGLFFTAFVCLFPCCVHAQVTDTTVCEILKNPQSFNGKTVRVKATVSAGFDDFALRGEGCGQKINAIWLSYPEGTKAKSGPVAMLQLQPAKNFAGAVAVVERPAVILDKNKDFKQFDSLLATPYKGNGMCLGCGRYSVSATLVGRLDGTVPELKHDGSGKIVGISGFGNLNAYSARLVLQSVSDISSQEIDYSKITDAVKVDAAQQGDSGGTIASEFGGGISLQDQPKRAAEAYGKEGDDNGVNLTSAASANEFSGKEEAKGVSNSPDGVLFNCGFDFDRLKGPQMALAMSHIGLHIADLRNPEAGQESAGAYQLEFRAWVTTSLSAIGAGQKNLILPGGYLIWSSSWPTASLNGNSKNALEGFLLKEAALTK